LERLETVAIVGVGLIGGSIGLALREQSLSRRVVGIGRNAARLNEAVALGAIDKGETDLTRGVAEADCVVVCTPVTQIAADVRGAAAHGPEDMLIMDAGSTKRGIVAAVERDPRARAVFVGGHPLAGSERMGAAHGRADLFEDRVCVLTPTAVTPGDRLERAREFWSILGCRLIELDPVAHDEALALTSHLPHALAAALAATVPAEALTLAAGAFRDSTRVAGSSATLWLGIFRENRDPLLRALDRFDAQLAQFRRALEADDEESIRAWWENARSRRGQFDLLNRSSDLKD
jgi:prephenate dehydrogenase